MIRRPVNPKRCLRFGILVALLGASPVRADDPTLYNSPDNSPADPGPSSPVVIPGSGVHPIYLWFDAGPQPTTNGGSTYVCNRDPIGTPTIPGGNGDETCGMHFVIALTGDITIENFFPGMWIDNGASVTPEINMSATELVLAVSTIAVPILPDPQPIGILEIRSDGPVGGNVSVSMLQTVDADLELKQGVVRTLLTVPEPGVAVAVAVAVGCLALGVGSRRGRSNRYGASKPR